MRLPLIARIFGFVFLLIGGLGFVPALAHPLPDAPHLVLGTTASLFGIFPVNIGHNAIHILIGLLGLIAGASFSTARAYFRFVALLFGMLAILGAIPLTSVFFGVAPIYGSNIWLHAIAAIAAIYFSRTAQPVELAA